MRDFLLSVFDSGLTTATIKNYRSAISAIHVGFPDGSCVSDNRALSHLIKGMFVSRLISSWDLFQVLSALLKAPVEQLGSASLLHLSITVVFLLAAATF